MASINEPDPSQPYRIERQTKLLANSEILSDVCFLVGPEKRKFFGHKSLLSLGSPVFFAMFNGDLKPTSNQPIEVPDLDEIGFLNMLKYIYGHKFMENADLACLASTHAACTKYLVHNLSHAFERFVRTKLSTANCCTLYEQLLEIEEETASLDCVTTFIAINGQEVLESDAFVDIDLDTLKSLLQLKYLNAPEFVIVKACFRWIDHELGPDAIVKNQQKLFKPIRSYLRLSKLTTKDFSRAGNLNAFLTKSELGELFLSLFDENVSSPFGCLTDRMPIQPFTATFKESIPTLNSPTLNSPKLNSPKLSLKMTVSRLALIKKLHTFVRPYATKPTTISIFEDDQHLDIWSTEILNSGPNLAFELRQFLKVHLQVLCAKTIRSQAYALSADGVEFNFSDYGDFRLIQSIDFYLPKETEHAV